MLWGGARTDEQLFDEARRGDATALGKLLEFHRAGLTRWLTNGWPTLTTEEIEDAVQECFRQILSQSDGLHIRSSFRTYLYSVARNRCLDIKTRKRPSVSLDGENPPEIQDPLSAQVEESTVFSHDFKSVVAQLSPEQQLILKLVILDHRTCTEVAAVLGTSVATVSRNLQKKILPAMRELLEGYNPCKIGDGECAKVSGGKT